MLPFSGEQEKDDDNNRGDILKSSFWLKAPKLFLNRSSSLTYS